MEANQGEPPNSRRKSQNPGNDVHRLSRVGESLYELLDVPKESTHKTSRKNTEKWH